MGSIAFAGAAVVKMKKT